MPYHQYAVNKFHIKVHKKLEVDGVHVSCLCAAGAGLVTEDINLKIILNGVLDTNKWSTFHVRIQ
jgi:hypothetical protein